MSSPSAISRLVLSGLAAVFFTCAAAFGEAPEQGAMTIAPLGGMNWVEAAPGLPPGAKVVLLEGDPRQEGPFVMRLRLPDGFRIPPHTHAKPERVTVLSGTLHLGMGGKFERDQTEALAAGTFFLMPPEMKHFAWAEGETILQLHGSGPWSITYVNPEDDPRNQRTQASGEIN